MMEGKVSYHPTGVPVAGSFPCERPSELFIADIHCQGAKLTVDFRYGNRNIGVAFDKCRGYRVLDEGDLIEFWPTFSLNHGWIYEIFGGGWKEQESLRAGFLSENWKGMREFLLAGHDWCISVFAFDAPSIVNDNSSS